MVVYHYTQLKNWKSIKEYGLTPLRDLAYPFKARDLWCPILDWEGKRKTDALFALPEPLPESWTKNEEAPGAWEGLWKHLNGRMLLEFELDKTDTVFVGDFIHRAVTKRFSSNETIIESEFNYLKKLKNITELKEAAFPEILVLNHISREKIKVSFSQPMLETFLKTASSEVKEDAIEQIEEIEELKPWFSSFFENKKELPEGGISRLLTPLARR